MSVQPSWTRSTSAAPPVWRTAKFISQSDCQPASREANHARSMGRLARTSMADGVRWKTYSSPASRATTGTTWTAVAPVPMTAMRRPAGSKPSSHSAVCRTVPSNSSMPRMSGSFG